MTRDESILELGAWLASAPGRYLLAWEQDRLDHGVADAFGFHALQLGLPQLDGLRANRMPHRWVASDSLILPEALPAPPPADDVSTTLVGEQPVQLHCEFDALPFPSASLDLVLMPHTLELAADPHQALREAERVLVPDGRLLITGFNPASLWGLRQRAGQARLRMGLRRGRSTLMPSAGEFIGYWRLRDWLRLLGFELEAGRFGCWRPPCRSERWLQRFAWIEPLGSHWWPVLGAVYEIAAVKRVRGMRLVGLARRELKTARQGRAVAAQRRREPADAIAEVHDA
ncbi:MAG: class I SAM-dependent methyltransferase [Burkholderiales bacterium]|nr:class I SAM-dependent methyltransferase [Burkholderiales bacterium]